MGKVIGSLRELFRRLPPDGSTRHLLRSFNLGMSGRGSPPSVKELAENLGFDVYLVDLPNEIRGRLIADPFSENGYSIEVNRNDSVVVRRWTVLHEIMHFLLHRNDDPFAPAMHRAGAEHFYDREEQQQERDANLSVEALIFGDGALEAAISLFGRDIAALCKHFGVSSRVMEISLAKLNR